MFEIANAKIGPWLQRVAHQRLHGTTAEKPADRLIEEVKFLQRCPPSSSSPSRQRRHSILERHRRLIR